jgi:molecular chaperone DnaJ
MPVLRTKQQGDLYIQVEVETPKNLSRKQRELLKAFEESSNASTSPESTGFFARVKELFERTGE